MERANGTTHPFGNWANAETVSAMSQLTRPAGLRRRGFLSLEPTSLELSLNAAYRPIDCFDVMHCFKLARGFSERKGKPHRSNLAIQTECAIKWQAGRTLFSVHTFARGRIGKSPTLRGANLIAQDKSGRKNHEVFSLIFH